MGRDYSVLMLKIRGKFFRLEDFANELGITLATLRSKITGKYDWKREEIIKVAELLDLTPEEILAIFF